MGKLTLKDLALGSPPIVVESETVELLEEMVDLARKGAPELSVDPLRFARRMLRSASSTGTLDVSLLSKIRGADLYLAEGCSQGDAASIALFDVLFGREFDVVTSRVRQTGVDRDDLAQMAREKLFVHGAIGDYSGQGDLRNWFRVLLTRLLLDVSRKRREEVMPGDLPVEVQRQPFAPYSPEVDPELDYMKAHYRDAFRSAFERAARSLTVDERNILRQHFSHGLGIDKLAVLFGVHRATAARRVTRAREELLMRTREELRKALGLGMSELDSVMRYIESQVHVSVERVLGGQAEG